MIGYLLDGDNLLIIINSFSSSLNVKANNRELVVIRRKTTPFLRTPDQNSHSATEAKSKFYNHYNIRNRNQGLWENFTSLLGSAQFTIACQATIKIPQTIRLTSCDILNQPTTCWSIFLFLFN